MTPSISTRPASSPVPPDSTPTCFEALLPSGFTNLFAKNSGMATANLKTRVLKEITHLAGYEIATYFMNVVVGAQEVSGWFFHAGAFEITFSNQKLNGRLKPNELNYNDGGFVRYMSDEGTFVESEGPSPFYTSEHLPRIPKAKILEVTG